MSSRRVSSTRCLLVAVAFAIVSIAGAASAACIGDSPEVVLGCYSEAHELRDIEMLDGLLADDYAWLVVTPHRAESLDRALTIKASRGMFADPEVESVSLSFADGHELVEGDEPGTWRIEGLRVTLSAKMRSMEEPHVVTVDATYYVRGAPDTESGYELYKEVTFEGVTFTNEKGEKPER